MGVARADHLKMMCICDSVDAFLHRMPILTQPSPFIRAWERQLRMQWPVHPEWLGSKQEVSGHFDMLTAGDGTTSLPDDRSTSYFLKMGLL